MYKDLKKLYNKTDKAIFGMAITHLLDIGFRRAAVITDEEISALKGNPMMTEDFVKQLVSLTREIAKTASPVEVIQFCQAVEMYDITYYVPNRRINYNRMEELATTAIWALLNDLDEDEYTEQLEACDIYLEDDEREFFGIPIEEEDDDYEE